MDLVMRAADVPLELAEYFEEIEVVEQGSVFVINTEQTRAAHFATFPRELVERCIKAGTSEYGVCATCEMPYKRAVRVEPLVPWEERKAAGAGPGNVGVSETYQGGVHGDGVSHDLDVLITTLGCTQVCHCVNDSETPATTPAIILDPFAGSCTTAAVATGQDRKSIMIEANPKYLNIGIVRMRKPRGKV